MEAQNLPPVASVDDIDDYLATKKDLSKSPGVVKLSKALKWYFLYTLIILLGLFVYANYHNIFKTLLTLNAVVVVIILALNYGLVVISYLTSEWPRAKVIDPLIKEAIKADGDRVLGYTEKILIIIHLATFYIWFPHPIGEYSDKEFYIASAVLHFPRVITFFARFPRKYVVLQILVFMVRVLSQAGAFLTIVCIIAWRFVEDPKQMIIVCSCLAGVPFAVFLGLFIRGLIFNKLFDKAKEKYLCFATQRRIIIFFVFTLAAAEWAGAVVVEQFLLHDFKNTKGKPTKEIFAVLCSATLLAIFNLAAMYYSLLHVKPQKRVQSVFRVGEKKVLPFLGLVDYSTLKVKKTKGKRKEVRSRKAKTSIEQVSLVIACNRSEKNIEATLNAALTAGFERRNIFIAHNGNSDTPVDGTGIVTWATRPSANSSTFASVKIGIFEQPSAPVSSGLGPADFKGVRYCYINVGNKTIGLQYVISNYVTTPLVMIIDDDVIIPSTIDMNGALRDMDDNEKMKAVAFTIRGIDKPNIWQSFQHLEYMQAGFVKIFQADFGSVLCCHGAIALWRTDTIKEILLEHNSEFHGEDLQMGLILRRMNKEYIIGVNAVEPVPTTAPRALLFEHVKDEKSLLVQRVFSWDMASHHFLLDFLEILVLNWERKSLILKPFLLTELWTQLQDWLRVILIFFMIQESNHLSAVWAILVLLALQLILVFIFDRIIIAHRPLLQVSRYLLLFYPVYNVISLIFRFGGLLVNTLYYTPWNPPRIKIRERIIRGELPPKVEIDNIPNNYKQEYWNTIWVNPEAACALVNGKTAKVRINPEIVPAGPSSRSFLDDRADTRFLDKS